MATDAGATTEALRRAGMRGWRSRARRALGALLGAAVLGPVAACGDSSTSADPVQQVIIEPGEPIVALGETVQLTATVQDADGTPLTGRAIVWASADPSIATVDGNGLVTPVAVGRVQVAASSEGQSGIVEVQIRPKRVSAVAIAVSAGRVEVGDTVTVEVTVTAADGTRLTDRSPTITSSAPNVASVATNTAVVAAAPGTAQIVAEVDGVSASTAVEVVPAAVATITLSSTDVQLAPGQTTTLGVTVRDKRDNVLTGRGASFTSSATGIATVTAGGTVRGVAPGTATITVRVEQVETTATVRVTEPPPPTPAPIARIDLSTGDFALRIGETRTIAATPRDAAGNALTGRSISWSSSDGGVASVSSTGLVTALGTGTARIEARSGSVTASVSVTVTPVPVGRVTVTPGTVSLRAGETAELTAATMDASGAPLPGRAVSWRSSAEAVATVNGSGVVSAVGPGSAIITATSEGVSGTATVTVTAAPPSPPGPPARLEIVSGDDQRGLRSSTLDEPLVVRVLDADGRPVSGVFVLWTPSHGGVALPFLTPTDASGEASTQWRLGGENGEQTMRASLPITPSVPAVTFTAQARNR